MMALASPSSHAEFAERPRDFCALAGGSVTRLLRTPRHNAAFNGVEHSAYLIGLAADVIYDTVPALAIRVDWAPWLGLPLISESDHDHLQTADWTAG